MAQKCQVKDCNGIYEEKILKYFNMASNHFISIHDYYTLPNRKEYREVTEQICNVCKDSLDTRLFNFVSKL